MNWEIPLSDPDFTRTELEAALDSLRLQKLSHGEIATRFEATFAQRVSRRHAVAVASGGTGLFVVLRALGIGPGDEVLCSPFAFKETVHAIAVSGARPVFCEIDYWAGTLDPARAESRIGPKTRALVAGNANGHPADWDALQDLADRRGLILLEDSSEALGSTRGGRPVGSFGRASVFDFSHPGPLSLGEGGMVATDDDILAARLRHLRGRRPEDRISGVAGSLSPLQCGMSEIAAAIGLAQLGRLDEILLHRRNAEVLYRRHIRSFEGIKDAYVAPGCEVHWMLLVLHLGKRFGRDARDALVEDLREAGVEAWPYCMPLHLQRQHHDAGWRRGDIPLAERIADRAVALPLHRNLSEENISFAIETMKDAATNSGAGAAIYL